MFGPHTVVRKHAYNCSRIFKAADHILYSYMWVWAHVRTLYSICIWERVQDGNKQEWQKCPAGTRQTDGKNWGLVWRNRKKISQIIKDYFHLPFFLLIILWYRPNVRENKAKTLVFSHWKRAFWACFRENGVYKVGHGSASKRCSTILVSDVQVLMHLVLSHTYGSEIQGGNLDLCVMDKKSNPTSVN